MDKTIAAKSLSLLCDLVKLYFAWFHVILVRLFRIFIPRKLKSLDGEIILITGAGNGIGRLMTHELSNLGAQALILWDVETIANVKTACELESKKTNTKIFTYTVDVSNPEEVQKAAAKVRREVGDVTVIFNNAGIIPMGNFLESRHEITKVFGINLYSHFWILREFLPKMIEKNHGHIVTIASIASFIPAQSSAAYCASKHAVHGFIESLKQEMRHSAVSTNNINFTTIYPMPAETRAIKGLQLLACFDPAYFILKPEYVACRAVKAFRQNYEHEFLPPLVQLGTMLQAVLSSKLFSNFLFDVLKFGVEIPDKNSIIGNTINGESQFQN